MRSFSDGVLQSPNFYRRIWRPDWTLKAGTSQLYEPERGRSVVAVSLGGADRSGGCQIVSEDLNNLPVTIAPGSAFIGNLIKPFTIQPIQTIGTTSFAAITPCPLDLRVWYDALPVCGFEGRGYSLDRGVVTNAVTSVNIPISGRKRVTTFLKNTGGTGAAMSVYVCNMYSSGLDSLSPVYFATLASGAETSFELCCDRTQPTVTGFDAANGATVITQGYLLVIANGSANQVSYCVEGRDY